MNFEVPEDVRPAAIDREEVRRALGLLVDPTESHEVRALPSGLSRTVHGNDLDGAVRSVEEVAGARATYLTLNPVRPDLRGAARVKDVTRRKLFLVDTDRTGHQGENATEAEKLATRAVSRAVAADLLARGWSRPVVVDSGNGWHLLFLIDLPNDKLSQQILKHCLLALHKAHSNEDAAVDLVVHNASRITKLPGTWVRKGPHTDERPHRLARIVSVPAAFTPVPLELLKELAGVGGEPPRRAAPNGTPFHVPHAPGGGSGGVGNYVAAAFVAECGRVENAAEGDRNNSLNVAAFNLGQLVHLGAIARPDMEAALERCARAAGLSEAETHATIRSGMDAGAESPRRVEGGRNGANGEVPPAVPGPGAKRRTIRASDVETKKVRWLWEQRVAVGFITVFAGRTGLGKSFVTCDFTARITQGEDLPDGPSGVKGEPRGVFMISEDPYDYVLVPRLIELGADLNLVRFLKWDEMANYTLDDTAFLEECWAECDDPVLIVIDPPTNFLGDKDEHKNAEVRQVLKYLVNWIATKDAACILITHVNKQTAKGIEALSRVIGSVAWTTSVRTVHLFSSDPDSPGDCLFLPDKNNIGEKAKPLGYRIKRTDSLATVEWLGEVDTTSDLAMAGEKAKPRRVQAREWLIERFREKREWPSDELFKSAREANLSRDAVFEGKNILGLPRARRDTLPNGDHCWVWWVPPNWEHLENQP